MMLRLPSPPPGRSSILARLTERQRQCLALAAEGLPSAAIAARLNISPRTVDEHLSTACDALGVRTRVQAVARLAIEARRPVGAPNPATVDASQLARGSRAEARSGVIASFRRP